MLVTCRQMSEAEEALFSGGVSAEPYMNLAGERCAHAIGRFFPCPGRADIFCGKGNNGGDALVVARRLKKLGWDISFHFSHGVEGLSDLAKRKWTEFREETSPPEPVRRGDHRILVDGLLGIGATGDLRGAIRDEADRLNAMREETGAATFAIDIPTGLNADTGEPGAGAIVADFTLSITVAKTGFAADQALTHLGRLVEIPLPIRVDEGDESIRFLFPSNLRSRLPRRAFDDHKGNAGRVLLVAGSAGMTGAGLLSATAASNTGAGLTTLCVPEDVYPIVASAAPAEVMVRPIRSLADAASLKHDVVGFGPGLGDAWEEERIDFLHQHDCPVVIDADGLNALAAADRDLEDLPGERLLTPHPGELARMIERAAPTEGSDRVERTRELADRWGVTLLHKGARTVIASPGRPVELNTTGHPGMASGGMGDVLTGICTGLAGQGLSLHDAACVGSWLLGRAAEIVRDESGLAAESVTASRVAATLGKALRDLRTPDFPEISEPGVGAARPGGSATG